MEIISGCRQIVNLIENWSDLEPFYLDECFVMDPKN
jgi:hypothetical protein